MKEIPLTCSTRLALNLQNLQYGIVTSIFGLEWTYIFLSCGRVPRHIQHASVLNVTQRIEVARKSQNLAHVYGCAPRTYCISCKPFGDQGNIYTQVQTVAAVTVVDPNRAMSARLIIVNVGAHVQI